MACIDRIALYSGRGGRPEGGSVSLDRRLGHIAARRAVSTTPGRSPKKKKTISGPPGNYNQSTHRPPSRKGHGRWPRAYRPPPAEIGGTAARWVRNHRWATPGPVLGAPQRGRVR